MGDSSTAQQIPALVTTDLLIVSAIFPLVSVVSIYYRWKARSKSRQTLGSDDWWLIASWIATFGISITIWVFAPLTGIDFYTVDPYKGAQLSSICLWTASFFNQIALTTVKIAICLFYKHVFFVNWFRMVTWITIALVSCWGIIFFFLVLFYGDPISTAWTGQGRWRYDPQATGLANVGTSIALDVIVLCLPLPVIGKLRLPTKKKIGISLIFWLGIFCCAAAIVRMVLLSQILSDVANNSQLITLQSQQFIFLMLEPHVSIIAACLPCYGPLIAGTRAPESLIRSVRSVLSLASIRGDRSGSGGSRGGSGGRSGQASGAYTRTRSQRPSRSSSKDPAFGSQVELHDRDSASGEWVDPSSKLPHQNGFQITVMRGDEVGANQQNQQRTQQEQMRRGIAVTREFDVVGANNSAV